MPRCIGLRSRGIPNQRCQRGIGVKRSKATETSDNANIAAPMTYLAISAYIASCGSCDPHDCNDQDIGHDGLLHETFGITYDVGGEAQSEQDKEDARYLGQCL